MKGSGKDVRSDKQAIKQKIRQMDSQIESQIESQMEGGRESRNGSRNESRNENRSEKPNGIRLDFPALPQYEGFARMVVSAFMLPVNPTMEELADVKTAVSEAVTNAIVHGYGGNGGLVRLRASLSADGSLMIDVCDRGCGIADIDRAREPFFTTAEGDERSGMGFTVMESFMDSVEVQSAPGHGTTVRLVKRLRMGEEAFAQRA